MSAQPPNRRTVTYLLVTLMLSISLQSAFADTVHLKNGRTLTVQNARIEGDQVVFTQDGNEIRIPKSLVEKIVEDDETAEVLPPPPRPDPAPTPATGQEGEAAADAEQVDPESTREYWQERVRAVHTEREQLEDALVELRREERAFLFSHRSTAETRRKIEANQARQTELDEELVSIRREARAKNIPPGWLRVRPTGA